LKKRFPPRFHEVKLVEFDEVESQPLPFKKLYEGDKKMKHQCPCCDNFTIKNPDPLEHEICPVCFWENDPIQNADPEYDGGANKVSLSKARKNYKKFGASEEKFVSKVRKPKKSELPSKVTVKQFFAYFSYFIWLVYIIGIVLITVSQSIGKEFFFSVVEPYFATTLILSLVPLQSIVFVIALVESIKAKTKIISLILHYLLTGVIWLSYIIAFVGITGGV